jgi:hypothetical protein
MSRSVGSEPSLNLLSAREISFEGRPLTGRIHPPNAISLNLETSNTTPRHLSRVGEANYPFRVVHNVDPVRADVKRIEDVTGSGDQQKLVARKINGRNRQEATVGRQ